MRKEFLLILWCFVAFAGCNGGKQDGGAVAQEEEKEVGAKNAVFSQEKEEKIGSNEQKTVVVEQDTFWIMSLEDAYFKEMFSVYEKFGYDCIKESSELLEKSDCITTDSSNTCETKYLIDRRLAITHSNEGSDGGDVYNLYKYYDCDEKLFLEVLVGSDNMGNNVGITYEYYEDGKVAWQFYAEYHDYDEYDTPDYAIFIDEYKNLKSGKGFAMNYYWNRLEVVKYSAEDGKSDTAVYMKTECDLEKKRGSVLDSCEKNETGVSFEWLNGVFR